MKPTQGSELREFKNRQRLMQTDCSNITAFVPSDLHLIKEKQCNSLIVSGRLQAPALMITNKFIVSKHVVINTVHAKKINIKGNALINDTCKANKIFIGKHLNAQSIENCQQLNISGNADITHIINKLDDNSLITIGGNLKTKIIAGCTQLTIGGNALIMTSSNILKLKINGDAYLAKPHADVLHVGGKLCTVRDGTITTAQTASKDTIITGTTKIQHLIITNVIAPDDKGDPIVELHNDAYIETITFKNRPGYVYCTNNNVIVQNLINGTFINKDKLDQLRQATKSNEGKLDQLKPATKPNQGININNHIPEINDNIDDESDDADYSELIIPIAMVGVSFFLCICTWLLYIQQTR